MRREGSVPVVPYINPNKTPPLPPDTLPLTLLPPLLAFGGFGGLWLAATALPPMLLLICPAQGSPALAILRAYWAGYLFQAVLGLLSPLIFGALIALIAWFMSRELLIVSIPGDVQTFAEYLFRQL